MAAYYFPDYHPNDPRNEKLKGHRWSEWDLVREAKPRFPGEVQPHVPLWGYSDESNPPVMEKKISAAADHGIDVFIFDWYYYNDGPFLQGALDNGFLKAKNHRRMKFALMWANHDWLNVQPHRLEEPYRVIYPGTVTPAKFRKICRMVIERYFRRESYWRIEGKPYFSFYDIPGLIANFGSVSRTRTALDQFRAMAVAAGFAGIHLNAVVWGKMFLRGEKSPVNIADLVQKLGFDSVTSYVWVLNINLPRLQTPYDEALDQYFNYWDGAHRMFHVPYFPNVTMGWDPSPRAYQADKYGNFGYPFANTMSNNSPEQFRSALLMAKQRAATQQPQVVIINAWNEWTEGSYLEPDVVHGLQYLDAISSVFGHSR